MYKELSECRLCPRRCGADRNGKRNGYCNSAGEIKIGRAALHFWEEPCISGKNGSGAVFFSGCNLGCVYCQNYQISKDGCGKSITVQELSDIFLDLQKKRAHNINLVTPTQYTPHIADALRIAKGKGLTVPVVYNCGGYESVEAIAEMNGLVDIYMPDFKYFSDKYAVKYSNAPHYFKYASSALCEMFSQVGKNIFDENGMLIKGVIVRHMMLPGLLFDSKKIIDYLYNEYGDNIYISIMSQYTPVPNVKNYPEINRRISGKYYESLVDYAIGIGVKNAYIQDNNSADECFIPEFYK